MQTTITLKKVSCGTELNIVQEGMPDVIPAEACYLGWQESLDRFWRNSSRPRFRISMKGCDEDSIHRRLLLWRDSLRMHR